jgi:hypothetical protein
VLLKGGISSSLYTDQLVPKSSQNYTLELLHEELTQTSAMTSFIIAKKIKFLRTPTLSLSLSLSLSHAQKQTSILSRKIKKKLTLPLQLLMFPPPQIDRLL